MDSRSVDTNLLAARVDTRTEFGDQLAIDLHSTFGDDLFAFSTRTEARLGQDLLQSDGVR
jgi:hypothetical protein